MAKNGVFLGGPEKTQKIGVDLGRKFFEIFTPRRVGRNPRGTLTFGPGGQKPQKTLFLPRGRHLNNWLFSCLFLALILGVK